MFKCQVCWYGVMFCSEYRVHTVVLLVCEDLSGDSLSVLCQICKFTIEECRPVCLYSWTLS